MAEHFKTANMALAAYLTFSVKVVRSEVQDGTCFWYFDSTEELQKRVTDFSGGTARIDPRAYSYKLTQMRKEIRSQ